MPHNLRGFGESGAKRPVSCFFVFDFVFCIEINQDSEARALANFWTVVHTLIRAEACSALPPTSRQRMHGQTASSGGLESMKQTTNIRRLWLKKRGREVGRKGGREREREERGETNSVNPLNRIDGLKANLLRECAGQSRGVGVGWG